MGYVVRLLFFLILLVLPFSGAVAVAGEDPSSIQQIQPPPLPEGYHYQASQYFSGFTVIVEVETLRPVVLEGFGGRVLSAEDLEQLKTWRSRHEAPWTTWAYEEELTAASRDAHNIRSNAGIYLIPENAYLTYLDFAIEKEGIELSPEERTQLLEGEEWPERITQGNNTYPDHFITRWYRRNISAGIGTIHDAIIETFAWASAPGYEPGTLPEELEAVIEEMKKGEGAAHWRDMPYPYQRMAVRASEIMRGEEISGTAENPAAGPSDQSFFALRTLSGQLAFMRDVRNALAAYLENPETFDETLETLTALVQNPPPAVPEWDVGFLEFHLGVLAELQEIAALPDDEMMEETGLGPMTVRENRARLNSYLEDYARYLDDTITGVADIIAETQP